MAFWQQLGDAQNPAVEVEFERIGGRGLVLPRIAVAFDLRTTEEGTFADMHEMRVRLEAANELIGEGKLGPVEVRRRESAYEVEIPVSRHALAFLNERLTGNDLDLVAKFSGWMLVRRGGAEQAAPEWQTVGSSRQAWLSFQVPRSDWFTKVLEPIGVGKFVVFEMPLPSGDLRTEFEQALAHLNEAERHYVTGSDPSVFSSCRAAFDALPGAKQHIYDTIADERKRKQLDDLAREVGEYLHTGRHVAESGEQQGEFPVDHRDAEFALAMTRLLVTYTAKLLG